MGKYIKKKDRVPVVIPKETPPPEKTLEDLMKKIYLQGYSDCPLYIYHAGNHPDTILYIKEFQIECLKYNMTSQVVIITDQFENIGINNCYKSEDAPTVWTDRILAKFDVMAVNILERPKITPSELFLKVKTLEDYMDDFVIIKKVVYV